MTLPRRQQISLEHTQYYHCTSRCVRRAFLCGVDRFSGKSFEHRKAWLEARLHELADVFAIRLLAYAVMSNHYHVVVRIEPDRAASWSDGEVIARWQQLYSSPEAMSTNQIAIYRERLMSLSWYMRSVNEPLARRSNREDRCKGRFWEGRFKCQALLDETALIRCMAYVDLNPVRAKIADRPEVSAHTSVKARLLGNDDALAQFSDQGGHIPIRWPDYLQLVDWTGRQLCRGKRGRISGNLPPILDRLGFTSKGWCQEMQYYGRWYYRATGSIANLRDYCTYLGQHWLKGQARGRSL